MIETDDKVVEEYIRKYEALEMQIAREVRALMEKDVFHPLAHLVDFTSEGICDISGLILEYGSHPILQLYTVYLAYLKISNKSLIIN